MISLIYLNCPSQKAINNQYEDLTTWLEGLRDTTVDVKQLLNRLWVLPDSHFSNDMLREIAAYSRALNTAKDQLPIWISRIEEPLAPQNSCPTDSLETRLNNFHSRLTYLLLGLVFLGLIMILWS